MFGDIYLIAHSFSTIFGDLRELRTFNRKIFRVHEMWGIKVEDSFFTCSSTHLSDPLNPITMRTFILGLLIWAIFTIFARWYFFCEIRQVCGETEEPPAVTRAMTLNLMDGDTAILKDYEQLDFKIDSQNFCIIS